MANPEQEINGDFEYALRQLIADLTEGNRSKADMLYRWDKARGDDWVTATKKQGISLGAQPGRNQMDFMCCPHCGESQDQSETRVWHSLGHADDVETECDHCQKPILVKANLFYEVCEVED